MTDKEKPDESKRPLQGSEGDAHKDFEPVKPTEDEPGSTQEHDYTPRHRAPGRPSLIRRRRNEEGESEEITWETSWAPPEDPPRWTEQEDSALAPPPAPIEDVPYLGPTRSQQRNDSAPPSADEERELVRRSRDYTGRHLAPKKAGLFGRNAPLDREASEEPPQERSDGHQAAAEGDIEADRGAGENPAAVPPSDVASPEAIRELDGRTRSEPEPEPESESESDPVARLGSVPAPVSDPAAAPHLEAAARQPEAHPVPDLAAGSMASAQRKPVQPPAQTPGHQEHEDPAAGPRTVALQQRKKNKRRWTLAGGFAAVVLALGVLAGAGLVVKKVVDPERNRAAVPVDQPEEETLSGTTLVFGTKESSSSARGAIWMTLLSLDAETGKGSVVYIPPHTAVEVPGRGLQGVGQAYGSGGVPLLLVSTENLLGVKIDRYLELSDKDALVFFENLDAMTVDVPAEVRVPAGKDQARLIFVEGPQELSPSLLVKLLYIVGIDGDDVELGSRHLAFWDELLNVYGEGAELAAAVTGAGAALGESDASAEEHGAFFAALADLPPEDLTITALPVRPISAGESELYATDEDELLSFVDETIGVDQERPQEIRVQILNGNGVPGIGQEVADLLVGEGFRVILSGNARRLNYNETLVIAYDNSEEGVALAERARDLLGVGEVQVSAQQQGIVDLTIVVGKDFLRTR